MNLAANAYAISPSLYDFERDEWEEQEIKRDARDAAFEKDFYWFQINLFCDRDKEKGAKKIADMMSLAMNNLYCNKEDCEKFEQAIFTWYCSNTSTEAQRAMGDLLDKHIKAVYRTEWEQEAV